MLSAPRLVELARALGPARRANLGPARLFDGLEPRALLGGDPFQIFTDMDGDTCRVTLQNSRPGDTLNVVSFGGSVSINATSTGPNSRLVITLDATDQAAVDNDRPTLSGINTTGVRTIDAPETDVLAFGAVNANRARSVTLGDLLFASLSVNTTGTQPRERSSITVRDAFGAPISIGGIADLLSARNLTNNQAFRTAVIAGSIVTLNVSNAGGLDARFDLTTTDAASDWSVKTLRVAGELRDGTWTLGRNVQSIRVGNVIASGGNQFSVIASSAHIGSIVCDTFLRGTWSVGSVGRVVAELAFTGGLSTSGDVDSFRTGDIDDANITVGRLGQLVADSIEEDVNIQAQRVTSFLVTRDVSDGTEIRITAGPRGDGSMGTFTIGGVLADSLVRIDGNAKTIRLGGIVNSTFYVGVTSGVTDGTLINDPSGFTGGNTGVVGSFRLLARTGDPANFVGSVVAMRQVGTLSSSARYATVGLSFGFSFQSITGSVSFRRIGSPTVTSPGFGSFTDGAFEYIDVA